MMFERLRSCSAVEAASSEEQPEVQQLPGKGYTVSRDWEGRAAADLHYASLKGTHASSPMHTLAGYIGGLWSGRNRRV